MKVGYCLQFLWLSLLFAAACRSAIAGDGTEAAELDWANIERVAGQIDFQIEAEWQGVTPAANCSDAEFARRAYLDLIGRVPRVSEARAFLDDHSPDKRRLLLDDLLSRPSSSAHLATVLRGIWLPRTNENTAVYHLGLSFDDWLRPQLQQRVPVDLIVRRWLTVPLSTVPLSTVPLSTVPLSTVPLSTVPLSTVPLSTVPLKTVPLNTAVTAPRELKAVSSDLKAGSASMNAVAALKADALMNRGDSRDDSQDLADGALAFYEINDLKPENLAGSAMRVLLGVRLECAQCHDHPFDHWSQDQFWQTAAFFTPSTEPVADSAEPSAMSLQNVSIAIPLKERRVSAQLLDGSEPARIGRDPRTAFAEWATSASNPYFASNLANRVWATLLGRGLIEPVDDFRDDNPPSHPALLDMLSKELVVNEFELRFLIAAVMSSKTYQRSSVVTDSSQLSPAAFARSIERPLTAEQLWQSLVTSTGYQDPLPLSHRTLAGLSIDSPRGEFIKAFLAAPNSDIPQMSLTHALKLMQGSFLTRMTDVKTGPAVHAIATAPFFHNAERVETLFLATLSRMPSSSERAEMLQYIESTSEKTESDRLGDVFWSLLNSSEYLLNH